jgi:thioredoxin-like negative regulator of GroEL
LKQLGRAAEVIEQLLALSPPEAIRDRLNYELSRTYIEMGQTQKASERLAQLARSSNSLWKAAAEQEIGYLELNGGAPKAGTR